MRIQSYTYDTCALIYDEPMHWDAGLRHNYNIESYCVRRKNRLSRASYIPVRTFKVRARAHPHTNAHTEIEFDVHKKKKRRRDRERRERKKRTSSLCRNIEITLSGQLTIKIYPNWFYCPIHKIWALLFVYGMPVGCFALYQTQSSHSSHWNFVSQW